MSKRGNFGKDRGKQTDNSKQNDESSSDATTIDDSEGSSEDSSSKLVAKKSKTGQASSTITKSVSTKKNSDTEKSSKRGPYKPRGTLYEKLPPNTRRFRSHSDAKSTPDLPSSTGYLPPNAAFRKGVTNAKSVRDLRANPLTRTSGNAEQNVEMQGRMSVNQRCNTVGNLSKPVAPKVNTFRKSDDPAWNKMQENHELTAIRFGPHSRKSKCGEKTAILPPQQEIELTPLVEDLHNLPTLPDAKRPKKPESERTEQEKRRIEYYTKNKPLPKPTPKPFGRPKNPTKVSASTNTEDFTTGSDISLEPTINSSTTSSRQESQSQSDMQSVSHGQKSPSSNSKSLDNDKNKDQTQNAKNPLTFSFAKPKSTSALRSQSQKPQSQVPKPPPNRSQSVNPRPLVLKDSGTMTTSPPPSIKPVRGSKSVKEKANKLEKAVKALLDVVKADTKSISTSRIIDRKSEGKSAWGPTISDFTPTVTVPSRVSEFMKRMNEKESLTPNEASMVQEVRHSFTVQMLTSALNAIMSSMEESNLESFEDEPIVHLNEDGSINSIQPVIRYKETKPSKEHFPDLQIVLTNVLRKFAEDMSRLKFAPHVDENTGTEVPSSTDDEQPGPSTGKPKAGKNRNDKPKKKTQLELDIEESNSLVPMNDMQPPAPNIGTRLVGRRRGDRWGPVNGITIYIGDGADMIARDYTDNVLDAIALRIDEEAESNPNMQNFVFIPSYLMQHVEHGDFEDVMLQPLIERIRTSPNITMILGTIHNSEMSDHWTLARINLNGSTNPHEIAIFDPLQTEGTYAAQRSFRNVKKAPSKKELENRAGIDETVDSLRNLRNFMRHVFPNDQNWNIPYPDWPLNERNIMVEEIDPQTRGRECGPILTAAIEYFANHPNFYDPVINASIRNGRWRELRYRQFLEFYNEIEGHTGALNFAQLPPALPANEVDDDELQNEE